MPCRTRRFWKIPQYRSSAFRELAPGALQKEAPGHGDQQQPEAHPHPESHLQLAGGDRQPLLQARGRSGRHVGHHGHGAGPGARRQVEDGRRQGLPAGFHGQRNAGEPPTELQEGDERDRAGGFGQEDRSPSGSTPRASTSARPTSPGRRPRSWSRWTSRSCLPSSRRSTRRRERSPSRRPRTPSAWQR